MKRVAGTTIILALAALVMAMGSYTKVFHDNYKIAKDSKLGKANCTTCHASAKNLKLTAYGTDMQKAMKAANSKKLTQAILSSIEKLDSNKNGKTNLEDIKADTLS
jgi:peroxiredoxin family protein